MNLARRALNWFALWTSSGDYFLIHFLEMNKDARKKLRVLPPWFFPWAQRRGSSLRWRPFSSYHEWPTRDLYGRICWLQIPPEKNDTHVTLFGRVSHKNIKYKESKAYQPFLFYQKTSRYPHYISWIDAPKGRNSHPMSGVFRFIPTQVFPLVLLVKVDERKRQRDVQGADLVRTATPLPRLERDHQVDVPQRSLRLERGHRLRAENLG